MKYCFRCGVKKRLSEFYVHSQMRDGHLNKCKQCAIADAHRHRAENIDKCREYDRNRPNRAERINEVKEYRQTKQGRLVRKKALSNYRTKHPEKIRAHHFVMHAIKMGRLVRQCCEVCGSNKNIEAHHDDYSRPLDVRWFCDGHHKEHHKIMRTMFRVTKSDTRKK